MRAPAEAAACLQAVAVGAGLLSKVQFAVLTDGREAHATATHPYAHIIESLPLEYALPKGLVHHTYPSLQLEPDRQALWDGLLGGTLSTTATDELPTSLELKLRGHTISDATGGNLGAEARLGIVYTEGVAKRGMSVQRFVEVTSTNAARIFGLFPRKGVPAVGSDADLTILNTNLSLDRCVEPATPYGGGADPTRRAASRPSG